MKSQQNKIGLVTRPVLSRPVALFDGQISVRGFSLAVRSGQREAERAFVSNFQLRHQTEQRREGEER